VKKKEETIREGFLDISNDIKLEKMFSNMEAKEVKTSKHSQSQYISNSHTDQSISNQKKVFNEKMCPLCKDFLTKSNQVENWNEIFEVIQRCYKRNDPKKLLFGNEDIDNQKIKEHIVKNGYQTLSLKDKNMSINNNCLVQ